MRITWSFVSAFLILISQIIFINAGCVWNGACLIQCVTTAVFTEIQQLWAAVSEFHFYHFAR